MHEHLKWLCTHSNEAATMKDLSNQLFEKHAGSRSYDHFYKSDYILIDSGPLT